MSDAHELSALDTYSAYQYPNGYWDRNNKYLLAVAVEADRLVEVPWAVVLQPNDTTEEVAEDYGRQYADYQTGELQLDQPSPMAADYVRNHALAYPGLLRQPTYPSEEVKAALVLYATHHDDLWDMLPEPLSIGQAVTQSAAHMTTLPERDGIGITVCRSLLTVDTVDTVISAYDIEETHRGVVRTSQIMLYGERPFAAAAITDIAGMRENMLALRGVAARYKRQCNQMAGRATSDVMLELSLMHDDMFVLNRQAAMTATSLLRLSSVPDCMPYPRLLQLIHHNLSAVRIGSK